MSLLIDFIDETEEVKDDYISLIRELVEKVLNGKHRRRGRIIGYVCR